MKYPVKLYSLHNQNSIQILAFVIDSCDRNCFYCYNKKPRTNKWLNLESLLDFIKKLHRHTGKQVYVDLIGGEPTLHPQLSYFCDSVSQLSYCKSCIYTNLSKDIDFFKHIIKKNISISATYHYFADPLGFYEKIKTIETFCADISINIMYEPDKISECINLYDKFKADSNIDTLELALIFQDTLNRKLFQYKKEDLDLYYSIVKSDIKKPTDEFKVMFNDGTEQNISFHELQTTGIKTKFWKCWAGIEYFEVDIDGDVKRCIGSGKKLFNINEKGYTIPDKPTICQLDKCICRWDITKERVFK